LFFAENLLNERIGLKATVEPRVTQPEMQLFGQAAEARSN
jgi:hypothetical protein